MQRAPTSANAAAAAADVATGRRTVPWRAMAGVYAIALVGTLVTTDDFGALRSYVSPLASSGMLLISLTHGWPRANGRRRVAVEAVSMGLALLALVTLGAHLLTR